MVRRRWPLCSPVTWPVVVAMGIALLAIGLPAAPQATEHPPRTDGAWGLRSPSPDDPRDAPVPSLADRQGHGLPEAGLRPERTTQRPAASRSIEPVPPVSPPVGLPRGPRLVTGRVRPGAYPGLPARLPL